MSLQVRVHAERGHGIEHDRFSTRIGNWIADTDMNTIIRHGAMSCEPSLPDTSTLSLETDISFSDPACDIGRKDLSLP